MKNEIQIIGDKIYYKMECVAVLNELNYTKTLQDFKKLLLNMYEREQQLIDEIKALSYNINNGIRD